MRISIWLVGLLLIGNTLFASDGVIEINQACALNGGCFSGDSTGFPVTIDGSAGKSYRLSGDLDLGSVPPDDAIVIDSPHVTLDLNGFEIAGPITCSGAGASLDCGAPGSASGIQVNNGADGVLIRNGTIRNMDSSGVSSSANQVAMMQLRAYNNGRDGLRGQTGSIVVDCIAVENGDDGFDFGVTSVIERSTAAGNGNDGFEIEFQRGVVKSSTARFNGGQGFNLGHSARFRDNTSEFNQEPDRCGGGICTSKRRIFLTQDLHDGNEALSACPDGFHMASLAEVNLAGDLVYDEVLGLAFQDQGSGPPVNELGWIRSGRDSSDTNNCEIWTVDDEFGPGGLVAMWNIQFSMQFDTAITTSPWWFNLHLCSTPEPVWCIED